MIAVFTQYLDLHKDIHNQTLCSHGCFIFSNKWCRFICTINKLQGDCELVTDTVRLVQDFKSL